MPPLQSVSSLADLAEREPVSLLSAADVAFVRATSAVRSLSETSLGRRPTATELADTERERGRVAGLLGHRLTGCESVAFVSGHARGSMTRRESMCPVDDSEGERSWLRRMAARLGDVIGAGR